MNCIFNTNFISYPAFIQYSYVFNCRGGLITRGGWKILRNREKGGVVIKRGGWKIFPKNDENAKNMHENERILANFWEKVV